MSNIKVCNFHSHLGSELTDDGFIKNGKDDVELFLDFADKFCDKFKESQGRGGFLAMDVFVQVFYLYLMAHKDAGDAIKVPVPGDIKKVEDINGAIDAIKYMIAEIKSKTSQIDCAICSRFIKKSVKATKTKLFDDAYVARGIYYKLDQKLKETTLDILNKKVKHYMELSLDITDLIKRDYKYVNAEIANDTISLLHMTTKHHQALSHDDDIAELDLYLFATEFKDFQETWSKRSGSPLIGVDWLAPEGYEFERNRTVRIVGNFLDILNKNAPQAGNKIVFRPHVGEGCSVFNGDQSHTPLMRDPKAFMANAWGAVTTFIDTVDKSNTKKSSGLERYVIGEFARYMGGDDFSIGGKKYDELKRRAINNTRVMAVAIATWINENQNHNLMFRLGHVSHCDSETANIIKQYGIYVDLNLGSNIRTGALNAAPGFGAIDYARSKAKTAQQVDAYNSVYVINEIKDLWGVDVYKDSGFYQLVKAGCKILIGDDGVGVEVTGIEGEYKRVNAVFDGFDAKAKSAYIGSFSDFYTKLEKNQTDWITELHGVNYENTYNSLPTLP